MGITLLLVAVLIGLIWEDTAEKRRQYWRDRRERKELARLEREARKRKLQRYLAESDDD